MDHNICKTTEGGSFVKDTDPIFFAGRRGLKVTLLRLVLAVYEMSLSPQILLVGLKLFTIKIPVSRVVPF